MRAANTIISPQFRDASRVALAIQVPLAVACLLLLDGGAMARICAIAMVGFWLGATNIAVRRPWSPTRSDLCFWRWGFLGCFLLAIGLAAVR